MIRNAAKAFYDRTGGEFSSVLSNLRKNLDFLGIECMRDCLTGDGTDLRDLKRKSLCVRFQGTSRHAGAVGGSVLVGMAEYCCFF
jgi:type IV secretory pathway TraG/TraD family ATPase VirD4